MFNVQCFLMLSPPQALTGRKKSIIDSVTTSFKSYDPSGACRLDGSVFSLSGVKGSPSSVCLFTSLFFSLSYFFMKFAKSRRGNTSFSEEIAFSISSISSNDATISNCSYCAFSTNCSRGAPGTPEPSIRWSPPKTYCKASMSSFFERFVSCISPSTPRRPSGSTVAYPGG